MAQSRAERERAFKASHGVSSGTYYEMRRKAQSRGIPGKSFDKLRESGGYKSAKSVTQTAATNLTLARHIIAASSNGVSPATMRAVYAESGLTGTGAVAAAPDTPGARYEALVQLDRLGDLTLSDFDTSWDIDMPDDFDWWYHG